MFVKNKYLSVLALVATVSAPLSASDGCSTPFQINNRIVSDYVKIAGNQNLPPMQIISYQYSYRDPFETVPSVAVSLGGFEVNNSSVLGVEVSVGNKSLTGMQFDIDLDRSGTWSKIILNFLSSDRPDFQFGQAILPAPLVKLGSSLSLSSTSNDQVPALTQLGQDRIESTNSYNMKINFDRSQIKADGLLLVYSSQNSSSLIHFLKVDLIIYNVNNPYFRYSQGLISQNNLSSKFLTQIPSSASHQNRTFIVGLQSFQADINAPISIFTTVNEKFVI